MKFFGEMLRHFTFSLHSEHKMTIFYTYGNGIQQMKNAKMKGGINI